MRASGKSQRCRIVIHPINQRMTRWAEYPHLLRSRILYRAPGSVTAMFGLMRDVQNPILTTSFAGDRCIRETLAIPDHVSTRDCFGLRSVPIFGFLLGVFFIEAATCLACALLGTFGRTMLPIPDALFAGKLESGAALATVTGIVKFAVLPKPFMLLCAPAGAIAVPSSLRFKTLTT